MANIIKGLFGGKKLSEPARDIRPLVEPLYVSAVHVLKKHTPSRSHFGGDPQLRSMAQWPHSNGKPLTFLARLSLSELFSVAPISWLPTQGALLFFYDAHSQPWGFDPKDRGSWAVFHVADFDSPAVQDGVGNLKNNTLPFRPLGFRPTRVLPSWEREGVGELKLTDAEFDKYVRIAEEPFGKDPKHQVSGLPSPVQGDEMELECQLVSHGIYCGDPTGYGDPRAASLRPGSTRWRLLLQVDTDDDLNVMWGDAGMLYFWVEEEAARAGSFENVWLVLQCA